MTVKMLNVRIVCFTVTAKLGVTNPMARNPLSTNELQALLLHDPPAVEEVAGMRGTVIRRIAPHPLFVVLQGGGRVFPHDDNYITVSLNDEEQGVLQMLNDHLLRDWNGSAVRKFIRLKVDNRTIATRNRKKTHRFAFERGDKWTHLVFQCPYAFRNDHRTGVSRTLLWMDLKPPERLSIDVLLWPDDDHDDTEQKKPPCDEVCAICLDDLQQLECVETRCLHWFHADCIGM